MATNCTMCNTATTIAAELVSERVRQQTREGYDTQHDDDHDEGELARGAAAYCMSAATYHHAGDDDRVTPPLSWPWPCAEWKPWSSRRDLVRAGALIIAEIERIDRAAEAER